MPQALTPEDIRKTTFHVVMRGYARDEVDEFLTAVSRIVGALTEKAETGYLNLGVRMGELLQEAKDAADELLANARTDVGNMLQEAKTSAHDTEQTARAQAEDAVRTATEHAAKIVAEAEERVADLTNQENSIKTELTSLRSQLQQITERLGPLVHDAPAVALELSENGHQDRSILLDAPPPPLPLGNE